MSEVPTLAEVQAIMAERKADDKGRWTHGECENLQLLLFGRRASYDECLEAICDVYAERDALREAAARAETAKGENDAG